MDKNQAVRILMIRYQFSHFFCPLLETLLERAPEGAIRNVLQNNLDEELGKSMARPGSSHVEERKTLLEAVGVNYKSWEPKGTISNLGSNVHTLTTDVIKTFMVLIRQPNYLVGVSAIAASEFSVPEQYRYLKLILQETHPSLKTEHLHHLTSHIKHDVRHAKELRNLLAKESSYTDIYYGKYYAELAWQKFWSRIMLYT
jgi:pyrroloquinoline quinone (PQQ) biosynthesis protein C